MALSPEGQVGHFESGLGWVKVHHPHNPPEKVTGSVQHDTSKQRYPCCVTDKREGDSPLEVEDVHWGQDDNGDCSLQQFEPGYGSEELYVRQGVNHCVLLSGQVRVSGQACDFRYLGSMEAVLDRCVTW